MGFFGLIQDHYGSWCIKGADDGNSDQTGFIGSFDFRDLWWMADARLREAETSAFLWARDILTSSMARSRLQVHSVLNASSRCLVSMTFRHHLQKKNRTRYFKIFLALRNRETTLREKRTTPRPHITAKNETARSVKFDDWKTIRHLLNHWS